MKINSHITIKAVIKGTEGPSWFGPVNRVSLWTEESWDRF